MIENFLSGGAGIEPIAGALFAVGVMLLLVEAVGPGLGASGFLGAGCALASFLPDAAAGSEPWLTVVLAGLGGALMLLDSRAAGFGAFGWVGLALLIAALGLGAATVQQFLFTLCGAAALSAAAVPVMLLRLPHSAAMAKIQLDERLETGTGRAAGPCRARRAGARLRRPQAPRAGGDRGRAVRSAGRALPREGRSRARRAAGGRNARRRARGGGVTAGARFGDSGPHPRRLAARARCRGKFGGQHCRP